MIPFVAFSLGRAWQGFWRNALMSLAATLTMVLMLIAAGRVLHPPERAAREPLVRRAEGRGRRLRREHRDRRTRSTTLVATIEAMPEIASVEFITPRRGARRGSRRRRRRRAARTSRQYLESNPLYASRQRQADVARPSSTTVTEALREDPIVRNVLNIDALVDRVLTVTSVVRTAGVAMVGDRRA